MWRINNIMLAVVLAGVIFISAFALIQSVGWRINEHKDQSAQTARTLDADGKVDSQGRMLRVQAVSYDNVISDKNWGPWDLVQIKQTASRDEEPLEGTNASPPTIRAVTYERRARFANNLVLRNRETKTQRILFNQKVAISRILSISHVGLPGVVVAYADRDTNDDGKLNIKDTVKLSHFDFEKGSRRDLEFEGEFLQLDRSAYAIDVFHFGTYVDSNSDANFQEVFEPVQLYEVALSSSSVRPVLNTKTVEELQALIDGVNDVGSSN